MTETKWLLCILAVVLGIAVAVYVWFVPWMDELNQKHFDQAKADMLVACGENKSIEVRTSNNGWTYNVSCQRPDGSVYLEVVG